MVKDSMGRELYDAICHDCGEKTQVPFKPREGRPIYCRACLKQHPRHERSFFI